MAQSPNATRQSKPATFVVPIILTVLLVSLIWVGWPIYGFLSNQFETARLPWGWHSLPTEMPRDEFVAKPLLTNATDRAMNILAKRREHINAPSISAAIAVNGQIIWAGAIGWSDVTNKIPVTTNTMYRIGSTSKAVGITGLARLVGNKIVDLDAPISAYSSNLPNRAWGKFTLRQLASHTAGLRNYEVNNDWLGFYQSMALTTRFNDPKSALSVFDNADLLFEPGESFNYSGFDNVLLSAIMQDVTEQPFNHVMSHYVFEPLGLNATLPDHLRAENQPFALSYQVKGEKVKPWRSVDLSHKLAAGGYVSTPSDLALIGTAWLNSDFISSEVRETFWTPIRLSNGVVNEQNYALGFRRRKLSIDGIGEILYLNHGGVSKGAECLFMIVPEYSLAIAVSINKRTEIRSDFSSVWVPLLEVFIPALNNIGK
jgi:CubicO group peptidase (beta-lactamase class C family)